MRYIVDHDYHIHSQLSFCSNHPQQTNERILEYAKDNNFKKIVLTNHFWDDAVECASNWYKQQNFEHLSKALPLPQAEGIEFLFGCEAELDKNFNLGIAKESFNRFDFVIIPTTHLHMSGFTIDQKDFSVENRARLWVKRLEFLLNLDLPFRKIGFAHLASDHVVDSGREDYLKVLSLIPESAMHSLFKKAADSGVGIELNYCDMNFSDDEAETVLKMFRIAKKEGCKFYLGSDAHKPTSLDSAPKIFERAVEYLGLSEDDKFHIKGE